ncbi:sulfotransferase family protein [Roseibium polysiphoniae]|uniref:Sulfotransferase family protein n=1 Tax=Roseibium polysiphoniae TaxID=2571221 RepID=A0ABR9C9R5_9HYPH|nr:sulfotransferase family protein [Roseibium polysiphoniae]MBD8876654.1 sulfotransferase family protein [Roseibium polysiphoniae]
MNSAGTLPKLLYTDSYREQKMIPSKSPYQKLKKIMSPQQFNYHFNISIKNQYVFVEVSKAACTTLKSNLSKLEIKDEKLPDHFESVVKRPHRPINESVFVKPYQLGQDNFDRIIRNKDFLKFAFVRDPYSRALSAYLDKFARGKELNVMRNLRKELAEIRQISVEDEEGLLTDVSFSEFCQALALKKESFPKNLFAFDQHWRPQAAHLCCSIIKYDFIGKIENFEEDIAYVLSKIFPTNITRDIVIEENSPHKTSSSQRVGDYYTTQERHIIEAIYAEDFELFDYPKI